MHYMLMLFVDESGWGKLTPAQQEQAMAAYTAYTQALNKAGVLKHNSRLESSALATTVRVVNGKSQVMDGPFLESKEQVGGYYVIEVADLDAALAWAARCPAVNHGTVEVRPLPAA